MKKLAEERREAEKVKRKEREREEKRKKKEEESLKIVQQEKEQEEKEAKMYVFFIANPLEFKVFHSGGQRRMKRYEPACKIIKAHHPSHPAIHQLVPVAK